MRLAGAPVLGVEPAVARKVTNVTRYQYKLIADGDGGDLAINKRSRPPQRFQPGTFTRVPRCCNLVVRQDGKGCADHILEVSFDCSSPLARRKALAAKHQFMPHWRSNCAFSAMRLQLRDNGRIGLSGNGRRNRARIEQIAQAHKETLRPVERSRRPEAKRLPTPISRRLCRFRNSL